MKITCLLVLITITLGVDAQGVFSNKTNSALQKVIEDYPNRFRNIIGVKITSDHRVTDYQSRIEVPGANASTISHYNNPSFGSYSWKSELFESGSFDESKQRFKEVFDNLKNTIIRIEGMTPAILNGKFESPTDDKITSIEFQLLPAHNDLQKLKVELSLKQVGGVWKVMLSVYEMSSL